MQTVQSNLTTKRAFSLLELLVAIAILSILSSLSIAYYNSYRQKAYDASALALLVDIRTALKDYCMNVDTSYDPFSSNGFNSLPTEVKQIVAKKDDQLAVRFHLECSKGFIDISVANCRGSGSYTSANSFTSSSNQEIPTFFKFCDTSGKNICLRILSNVTINTVFDCSTILEND